MDSENRNTVSTDIISVARQQTKKALESKNLSVAERAIIQNQDVILMFTENDHPKIVEMWDDYRDRKKQAQRWEPRVWQTLFVLISWAIMYFLGKM